MTILIVPGNYKPSSRLDSDHPQTRTGFITMKTKAIISFLVFVLAGCAGAPSRVFVKDDVTWTSYRADLENCYDQARGDVPVQSANAGIPLAHNQVQNFAVGFAGGFIQGLAEARAEESWATQCMENNGYTEVDLEQSERSKLASLKTDEQRTQFLRGEPIEEYSVQDAQQNARTHTSISLSEPQPVSSGSSPTRPGIANNDLHTETTNNVSDDLHDQISSLPGATTNLPTSDFSWQLTYWRMRDDIIRKAIARDQMEVSVGFGFAHYQIEECNILDAESRVGDANVVALTVQYDIVLQSRSNGGDPTLEPIKWFQRTIIVDNTTEAVRSVGQAERINKDHAE